RVAGARRPRARAQRRARARARRSGLREPRSHGGARVRLPQLHGAARGSPGPQPLRARAGRRRLERGSGGRGRCGAASRRPRIRRRRLGAHPRRRHGARGPQTLARPRARRLRIRNPRRARRRGAARPHGRRRGPPARRARGAARLPGGLGDGTARGGRRRPVPRRRDARRGAVPARRQLRHPVGHGVEELRIPEEPGYPDAFRAVWQGGAATLPLSEHQLTLVEPLTRWLVERGRALGARELGEALAWLAEFERRTIARFAPFDAVLTPALALTPRPVGWYDAEDGERNFEQQVRYTPFTSFVNVAGLPAITLPVAETEAGLPMGVQLIGRPGGERTLLALGA